VVDVNFHEMRHAAANAARQAGMPENALQRLMNHRNVQQTQWYFRRSQKQRLKQEVGRARRMKGRSAKKRAIAAGRTEVSR
jgi:integrase